MKRALIVGVCLIGLSAGPAHAFCLPSAKPGSATFNREIREWGSRSIIVRGVIGRQVPADAHAAWSIFLHVDRYLVGHGKRRIEITSNSDGDLRVGARKPGASKQESREFLKRNAGREAIFFAGREGKRYDPGYATSSCLYNRIGHRDAVEMERFVLRALSDGELVATGSEPAWGAVGLGLIGLGLLARHQSLKRAGGRLNPRHGSTDTR